MIWRFRRWLADLLLGPVEYPGGIGYPGSVGAICGDIRRLLGETMPLGIEFRVGHRWVRGMQPGTVRVIVEAPR